MAKVQANSPELLLFTGDLVDEKRDHIPALPLLRKFLAGVHGKYGSFATIGNHDGDLLAPLLGGMGVRLIMNDRVEVSVRGATIELIGFPGPERDDLDEEFVRSLPARRAGVPRIVVSHYPDLIRAASAAGVAPDLFLAGHTHGGQCCLPNETSIIKHDSLPRHLCKGAHNYNGTCLIVTRGMGFTTLPIRVFCPGETIEIVLRSDMRL